ncbi:MAG: hypothetical protein ABSB33_11765 [Tepidisphaeraceae bacterium]|jgi:hypothetical protein
MPFKFKTYSPEELETCGRLLRENLLENAADNATWKTPAWTLAVKSWFHGALADGAECYGQPYTSEYKFDQCHTATEGFTFAKPGTLLLVLESEWGAELNRWQPIEKGRDLIMEDAQKIACERAVAKVMVFGSNGTEDQNWILQRLSELRNANSDGAPWLWFDVSWKYSGLDHQIRYGLFAAT